MLLKIMGDDDTGDDDSRKTFQLLDQVTSAKFEREGGQARVDVLFDDGAAESFPVHGNVYLMNDQGKTVAHFGSHPVG